MLNSNNIKKLIITVFYFSILPSQETVHVSEFVNFSFFNGLNNTFLLSLAAMMHYVECCKQIQLQLTIEITWTGL